MRTRSGNHSLYWWFCLWSKHSSSKTPSFSEVGKAYFIYTGAVYKFHVKIARIENTVWLLAELLDDTGEARKGELVWLNTAQLLFFKR